MKKEEIRKEFGNRRKALTELQYEKLNDLLLIQFQNESFPFLHNILSYFPMDSNNEPDTFLITRYLKFLNPQMQIAYPTMINSVDMQAVVYNDDSEFVANKFGVMELNEGEIMQSNQIDLILVPMLQCDYKGNRVGYGKGYYDRFMVNCNSKVLKVGLSFFDIIDAVEDVNNYDIPLTHCITPELVYEF